MGCTLEEDKLNIAISSPFCKATAISLLIHGVLIIFLLVLWPLVSIAPTSQIIPVEIVPAKALNAAMPTAAAAPLPPETQPAQSINSLQQRAAQLPFRAAAAQQEALPAALPGETSETSVAVPVPWTGTAIGMAGTEAALTGTAGGSGSQSGVRGDDGSGMTGASCLFGPKPAYPPAARRAREEGNVLLRLNIDKDGTVSSVTVIGSSGYSDLDDAALQELKEWRYSPARKDGIPVVSFKDVRLRFRLDDAE